MSFQPSASHARAYPPHFARRSLVTSVLLLLGLTSSIHVGHARPIVSVLEASYAAIKDDVRAVVRCSDGTLVVGSNALSVFDGAHWQPVDIPGAYGFRALAKSTSETSTRVWVGAIGAVGFIERDAAGRWRYHSLLSELAQAGLSNVGDVWSVRPLGAGALWVSTEHAFRWQPSADTNAGRFDVWHLPATSRLSAFGGGTSVWIHQQGSGLLRVSTTLAPTIVVPEENLPESPITWMVDARGERDQAWIGLGKSAYRWSNSTGFSRNEALSRALSTSLPTDAVALDEDRIAIATFNRGAFIADSAGRVVSHYSSETGLPDDSLYSLAHDKGQLWCASPQGLIRIDGPGRAELFDRTSTFREERPLASTALNDTPHVLTARKLLRFPTGGDRLAPPEAVLEAPARFADLIRSGTNLWVAGFGGLWRVDEAAVRQELFVSADVLNVTPSRRVPGGLLFTEGYRVKLLQPGTRGAWVARDLEAFATDSPVSLFEDKAGDVWLSTMQDGVMRLIWERSTPMAPPRLRHLQHYRPGVGLPHTAGRVKLVARGKRLFAFTDAGILALRPDLRGFEPMLELSRFIGVAAENEEESPAGKTSALWIVQHRLLHGIATFGLVRVENTGDVGPQVTELAVPGLDRLGVPTSISTHDDSVWITGSQGLLRVETKSLAPSTAFPAPLLHAGRTLNSPSAEHLAWSLPAATNGEPHLFQTRVSGASDSWSAPTSETTRGLEGLAAGHYRFEVRALDRFGRAGLVAAHDFTVPAPWWKTVPALAAYGAALVLIVLAATRWQIVRLRRQNEQLNRLVAERTREIELASTAKSEFLENISHEIRNPLNGLTGLLAMLDDARLGSRERELAGSLKSIGARLTKVFEEVLQFSKLEYGYGRAEQRPFSLRSLLQEVVTVFSMPAKQAGCDLTVHWPATLVDGFTGDPGRITTILSNFVSNAVKYAPGAPIDVRVKASEEADSIVHLLIEVADHGLGVPPDEQELIFKKFVRGQHAHESGVPGTGLGLASCRVIAKLINASVALQSVAGRGATFRLELRLPRSELPKSNESSHLVSSGRFAAALMLIVDDEPYNRLVLENIAAELGFTTDSAGSAEAALHLCDKRDYAVLLLDWELPDGNGGDIARRVRARARETVPIILATTAHDSDEMRQRCLSAGMNGFILKPYNATTVRAEIERHAQAHGPALTAAFTPIDGHSDASLAEELDLSAFEYLERARPTEPGAARQLYVEALDAHLERIDRAHALGDTRAIASEAHQLRALSGLLHATDLNRAAAQLEAAARAGVRQECSEAWAHTLQASEHLKQRLAAQATPKEA